MKTLFGFILVFVLSLSTFAQNISINSRVAGAGTNISVNLQYLGDDISIKGFELTIYRDTSYSPNYFNFGYPFYNWTSAGNNSISSLKIAAVGSATTISNGQEIGRMNFHISENLSGNLWFPRLSFFDSENYWGVGTGSLRILNLPTSKYGDLDGNGIQLKDAIMLYDLLGTISLNDTINVITDLDGDGYRTTYDLHLELSALVNLGNIEYWPIFYQYNSYNSEKIQVTASWKKIEGNKWGLFSEIPITNGDFVDKGNSNNISMPNGNNFLFKKVNEKIYFAGQKSIVNSPIIIADAPIALTGTVNNGCPINIISTPTGVEEKVNTPEVFTLEQNYPNPFNPSTTINYQIPTTGMVTLKIYDVAGKEVATLVNETKEAGNYSVKFNAAKLTSGTYVYRIKAGNFTETKKMILMK